MKADATKRDHRTGSNRPKTARASGLMQQSERSGSKKKEVASTAGEGAVIGKVTPVLDPKDSCGQPNAAATDVERELLQDELDPPAPHKGENDEILLCSIDLGKEVQTNVPPSDPISCFTSDDEEMLHVPTRKSKRPFDEVSLDSKAGMHGSPEDHKRRNAGPPQLQARHTLHTVREKGEEPIFDAARFRASVKTDPTKDIESEREACQVTKANESRQPLNDQQICFEEKVTMDQAQVKGGYGVISLFDGVSSVVPTLTRKFGYAPAVAILGE